MTDPTIIRVDQFPNTGHIDSYYVEVNIDAGAKSANRIPAHYVDAVATIPEVREWMTDLVRRAAYRRSPSPSLSTGGSLLLLGGTGSGKTFQAYGAIRALCLSGVRAAWHVSTAAEVYARLRPRHGVDSEQEFDRISRAALLVLDDLGAAKGTEWTEEINYRLINHRYENELPTIITSNLAPSELRERLGERVLSRIREMCQQVSLKGADRRVAPKAAA